MQALLAGGKGSGPSLPFGGGRVRRLRETASALRPTHRLDARTTMSAQFARKSDAGSQLLAASNLEAPIGSIHQRSAEPTAATLAISPGPSPPKNAASTTAGRTGYRARKHRATRTTRAAAPSRPARTPAQGRSASVPRSVATPAPTRTSPGIGTACQPGGDEKVSASEQLGGNADPPDDPADGALNQDARQSEGRQRVDRARTSGGRRAPRVATTLALRRPQPARTSRSPEPSTTCRVGVPPSPWTKNGGTQA